MRPGEREEWCVWWSDDTEEPLVIYPTYAEAMAVAEMGQGLALHRVVRVTPLTPWEPARAAGKHRA